MKQNLTRVCVCINLLGLLLLTACTSADVYEQVQHNTKQSCERKIGEPLCSGEHDLVYADCERKFGADLCRRPFAQSWEEYSKERDALSEMSAIEDATEAAEERGNP